MCMEDIRLGRKTTDSTTSLRFSMPSSDFFNTPPPLTVIPANQFRVGLRLYGKFIWSRFISETVSQTFELGWIEVWRDADQTLTLPIIQQGTMVMALTTYNPTVLMRVEEEGTLLQRKFILVPRLDPLNDFELKDVFVDICWTEYTLVEEERDCGRSYGKSLQGNPAGTKPLGYQPTTYRKGGASWS